LDDHTETASAIGIFHLRLHARLAEVELGADTGSAQLLRQLLVVADAVAVEHEHNDRTLPGAEVYSSKSRESRKKTGDPNRKPGCWFGGAHEASNKLVIAPACPY